MKIRIQMRLQMYLSPDEESKDMLVLVLKPQSNAEATQYNSSTSWPSNVSIMVHLMVRIDAKGLHQSEHNGLEISKFREYLLNHVL